jgi:hypothetical protein
VRRLVGVEGMERLTQRADQLIRECVQFLGAVERERDDFALLLIVHERHRFLLIQYVPC